MNNGNEYFYGLYYDSIKKKFNGMNNKNSTLKKKSFNGFYE